MNGPAPGGPTADDVVPFGANLVRWALVVMPAHADPAGYQLGPQVHVAGNHFGHQSGCFATSSG
jgi:hypothetical protein